MALWYIVPLLFAFTACEEPIGGGGDGHVPDPPTKAYVGAVEAEVGDTDMTLVVDTDDTFVVATVTPDAAPSASAGRVLQTATTGSATATFVVLAGTVSHDGTTVTFKVERVKRDGKDVTAEELAKYQGCPITAPVGASFHEEAAKAAAKCLTDAGGVPVTGDQVNVNPIMSDPVDRVVGKWTGSMRTPYAKVCPGASDGNVPDCEPETGFMVVGADWTFTKTDTKIELTMIYSFPDSHGRYEFSGVVVEHAKIASLGVHTAACSNGACSDEDSLKFHGDRYNSYMPMYLAFSADGDALTVEWTGAASVATLRRLHE